MNVTLSQIVINCGVQIISLQLYINIDILKKLFINSSNISTFRAPANLSPVPNRHPFPEQKEPQNPVIPSIGRLLFNC